ncbi:MAG: hypothetical protein HYY46_01840, partial [Deltaproteobacteria bacterium]|nr:hypothetical protein [Deltaproteobacteria bacterium]
MEKFVIPLLNACRLYHIIAFNVGIVPLKILKRSEGLALFTVLFAMAIILMYISANLFFSGLNLKTSSNVKFSDQGLQVAEAGLHHALTMIPWGKNFNKQIDCPSPPCVLVPNTSFPSTPGFSYTVTAKNDPIDPNPNNDTNNLIILDSTAYGPNGATRKIKAYVGRSNAGFTPPAASYVDASSATPTSDSSNSSSNNFFDYDDSMRISGNDWNAGNLLTTSDDTQGPKAALRGIATTSDSITNALKNQYNSSIHQVLGLGAQPSIETSGDLLDVKKMADDFSEQAGVVPWTGGLDTDSVICPSSLPQPRPNPDPCVLGTSSAPQITYVREPSSTDYSTLRGNVTGYGVLVL